MPDEKPMISDAMAKDMFKAQVRLQEKTIIHESAQAAAKEAKKNVENESSGCLRV